MRAEEIAYKRGFRMDKKGNLYNPKKEVVKGSLTVGTCPGYLKFGTGSKRFKDNPFYSVLFHRFQAYMKYKSKMYDYEVVRHLNGVRADNSYSNIEVGSHSDNHLDMPLLERRKKAYKSAKKRHSLTKKDIDKILKLKNEGVYYKDIAKKFEISKGWVCMIVTHRTYYTTNV